MNVYMYSAHVPCTCMYMYSCTHLLQHCTELVLPGHGGFHHLEAEEGSVSQRVWVDSGDIGKETAGFTQHS